eukprot:SAG11_NODE_36_length_21869_cov_38.038999_10_plen_65_part_00
MRVRNAHRDVAVVSIIVTVAIATALELVAKVARCDGGGGGSDNESDVLVNAVKCAADTTTWECR